MNWTFAVNDGGRETGFHDAGVENFKGNFDRYLAREVIQNSLDARANPKSPVQVRFDVQTFKSSDIPDMGSLRKRLKACAEYWKHDPKAKIFFQSAEQLASKPSVQVLRISDFGTKGVTGTDIQREKPWYNLI